MADGNQTHENVIHDGAPPPETTFEPAGEIADTEVEFDSAADEPVETPADTPAANTIQTLKDSAATITKNVGEKAKAYAEDNKAKANGALDELATMINDAAATVDEKIGPQYGQYARTAADTVTGFSDSLKSKNVDDLIADATTLVKKSPAIAIGAAAAIGFVLIRLVQSGLNADTDDNA